ncbi:hypothetical protein KMZ32_03135 [Phycicoccus sp. MAQZ13P-2]|uniref:hypothetical protein n=1 Tax=Phycicoccus mangrovi TaxID=2840470 RepID=UPI001C007430|nr:hypothetical protein [Phycicoccus mangrovi]MBT9254727.1 hypothetical protein [Phycicoccus mangrovi]MBT9273068.1 hypothetical protein [Phycicoccus mangrovi]
MKALLLACLVTAAIVGGVGYRDVVGGDAAEDIQQSRVVVYDPNAPAPHPDDARVREYESGKMVPEGALPPLRDDELPEPGVDCATQVEQAIARGDMERGDTVFCPADAGDG